MAEDKKRDRLPIDGAPPQSFLDAKMALRRELIALPFEEKIKRVIEMQRTMKALRKDGDREVFVWKI
jgi:hypothetical protein